MTEVLFEITKDNLETGLRGYPVGYCTTSYVDPEKGLFYIGIPVKQMKDFMPLDVIYLLYHGEQGTKEKVKAFSEDLNKRAPISQEVLDGVSQLPKKGHPMDLFAAAIQILGMVEGTKDYAEDALNLIAKLPQLAAHVINHHAGWESNAPNYDLEYMENFTHMLGVPNKNAELLTKIFRLFNILHFDHGGGNLSAFTGKTVASGLQHLYGSIAASMNALAGPRHGRANQDCLEFVNLILKEVGEEASEQDVEMYIRKRIERKELVFGFGHAVLRVEDPRATIFYDFATTHFPDHPLVKIAHLLRKAGSKVLAENPKISDPHPNIDVISGSVLTAGGFGYPEYFTILFGLSRTVGIAIQILYERLEARNGKGTPIVRPKFLYRPRG